MKTTSLVITLLFLLARHISRAAALASGRISLDP